MSGTPDLDRRITAWLDDRAVSQAPDDLLGETLARTSRLARRPAWRIPERWIPMPITLRLAVVPRALVYLLVLALLLAMLAAGGLVTGSLRHAQASVLLPTGPARNGLIAYGILGDIWVMDQHGDVRTQLTSGTDLDYVGVWSPDGTQLAYWSLGFSGDPSDATQVQAAIRGGQASVKVIRADGSDPRTLASGLIWPSDCGTDMSWSPDSSAIAFARTTVDNGLVNEVDIVAIGGGQPRQVASHALTPAWSPDGTTIAYLDDLYLHTPDGTPAMGRGVSLVPAEGGDSRPVSRAVGDGCAFNEPQWSNDGRQVVFYGGSDGVHDVYVARSDGTGEVAIATDPADEYWPRWSPDNTRIAFDRVVLSQFNAPQFVLTDPDGGNQVMLDHPPLSPRYPTWSPDGTLLLGMTMDASFGDTTGLILVDVAGAVPPVTIETGPLWGDPAWQRLAP